MTTTRALLPDRALDALAAEKVLGWKWFTFDRWNSDVVGNAPLRVLARPGWEELGFLPNLRPATGEETVAYDAFRDVPHVTRSLDAALTLADALRAKGWGLTINLHEHSTMWDAMFYRRLGYPEEQWHSVLDANAARAITAAALLAVGADPYALETA